MAAGVLALSVPMAVLSVLAGSDLSSWWEDVLGTVSIVVSLALGLLIAVRRPGNRMASLLLANAAIVTLAGLAEAYAFYGALEHPGSLPGVEWAVLWDQTAWPLIFAPVLGIALLFPDGRLPSPRWRPVALGVAATIVLTLLVGAFEDEPFDAPYAAVDNPLPATAAVAWLWPLILLGGLGSVFVGAKAVRTRFARARGVERQQLKWLAYSAALIPATLLGCLGFAVAGPSIEGNAAFTVLLFMMLTAIPASVAVAVLRHRLYDIDRLINRTLVYGVLTVLLAVTYAIAAIALGTALGAGSPVVTAGATLIAAVAFSPLRSRIQDLVDRRFSRSRYDARRRIAGFLAEVHAGRAAPEAVEPILAEIAGDPSLELCFWLPESELYVDALGRPAEAAPAGGRVSTPVTRAGDPLALVVHRPADDESSALLDVAVQAAGLAIEIVRLRVELRRQLAEVEESRARIVAAGYAERRRLERDLHDGAQQRLVSIGLALRHAQNRLDGEAGEAGEEATVLVDGAVDELAAAIDELRELARGVRPAQLEAGLAPALQDLASRAPLPVDVQIGAERFAPDVEATAYFIASECLTNAVKHARPSHVRLEAARHNGTLTVVIADDGIGGATPSRGSGLSGLADRVEAQRGRIEIESPQGHGTTIVAELPCG